MGGSDGTGVGSSLRDAGGFAGGEQKGGGGVRQAEEVPSGILLLQAGSVWKFMYPTSFGGKCVVSLWEGTKHGLKM